MLLRTVLTGAVLSAALMTAAWADIVHLRGGGRLEGVVEAQGDALVVTNRYGSTSVALSAVRFVEKTASVLDEYRKLASKAAPENLQAQRRMAKFCRDNHLTARERRHLLLVLRLRPDDIQARSRLGFVMHRGQWLTKSEEMYDRGLTRFRGEWMTHGAKEAALDNERERRRELAAKRRSERDERLARLKAKRLAEAQKARERERASAGVLGIGYVDDSYYRGPAYRPYYRGYSVTAPRYGGGYYYPYSHWGSGWTWYRRWTGAGLSVEYKSRDWRVKWGR